MTQDSILEKSVQAALDGWITARIEQKARSTAGGSAQQGNRAAVVGGKHLDGVNALIADRIMDIAGPGLEFRVNRAATLPGFYRPTKSWDLVVVRAGTPVLAVEYKSMVGSEGKNLNNRADEIFGMAEDLRQAEIHGLLPKNMKRAYVFIMGITSKSTEPVGAKTQIGTVDPIFDGASYLERAALMCERMRETGLFNLVWMIGVDETTRKYREPRPSVGWNRFEADLTKLFIAP
jgi:Restriction endonuclease XhoI